MSLVTIVRLFPDGKYSVYKVDEVDLDAVLREDDVMSRGLREVCRIIESQNLWSRLEFAKDNYRVCVVLSED